MAATNALAAANMVILSVDALIPLDETIKVMFDAGIYLPLNLKDTARGGLSITKTAQVIDRKINGSKLKRIFSVKYYVKYDFIPVTSFHGQKFCRNDIKEGKEVNGIRYWFEIQPQFSQKQYLIFNSFVVYSIT